MRNINFICFTTFKESSKLSSVNVLKDFSTWCRLCKRQYFYLLLCQFLGKLDVEAFNRLNNPFAGLKNIDPYCFQLILWKLMIIFPTWCHSVFRVPNHIRPGQKKLFLMGTNPWLGEILHSYIVTFLQVIQKSFQFSSNSSTVFNYATYKTMMYIY